ncbi:hypothetical protein [Streptococcus saliviloxodontae]|uniref:Bacteriocin-type signal sequence n=1 Tax=Streptococcus saliviloxodontae TaxID=1349416 RepID=A0ABS2PJT7_9STRE|nr:hypothetical protein [Streptococcus saliviloxodontae]MBM7635552.1 hypothetical protein [Streptococcus saliviloxodontae]
MKYDKFNEISEYHLEKINGGFDPFKGLKDMWNGFVDGARSVILKGK